MRVSAEVIGFTLFTSISFAGFSGSGDSFVGRIRPVSADYRAMTENMSSKQKFDGLADDYDQNRPRYPSDLFQMIKSRLPVRKRLRIIDAGAGTGIALEGLIDVLGQEHDYLAVDVSTDMVESGRQKFPFVEWTVGEPIPR